ncbi:MAG: Omp28-related outer membrane protein [Bacteroidaceae bacterium]|nr:Omp28-related outer membrane protein [Bacteroidaceae bacterium]
MKKFIYSLFAFALLLGVTSCNEEGKLLEGTPVLSTSADIFVADGEEELVITVKVGDVDVTEDATIYVDNKPMQGNVFTTTTAKNYKFYASYNGKLSNTVTVTAANPALYLELPEDTQPDKFDGFHHKVLMTQATGTWCGWCPCMIRGIELFQESGANAANTVVVAVHSGDELSSEASEATVAALKAKNFPSAYFSLNPEALVESYTSASINAENINAAAGMELMEEARVGITATSATSADKSVIAVRTAVKVGKPGSYRINVWLVEDAISAYQSSYWAEFTQGVIDHNHVLRAASCESPIQGESLGGKTSCRQGETFELYHEFNVAEAAISNVANCKVVVLVTAGVNSKFYVDNVIECPVGESVPFAYSK